MDDSTLPSTSRTGEKVIPVSDELLAHLATEADTTQVPTVAHPTEAPPLDTDHRLPIEPIINGLPESPSVEAPIAPVMASVESQVPPVYTPPVANEVSGAPINSPPSQPTGLTPEQEKFIHRPALGALIPWIYFGVNGSVKWALIYFFLPNILGVVLGVLAQVLQFIRPVVGDTGFTIAAIPVLFIPGIAWFVLFIRAILRGRRIAWEAKTWASFEAYKKFQQKCDWLIGGGFVVIVLLLVVCIFLIVTSYSKVREVNQAQATQVEQNHQEYNARVKVFVDTASAGWNACMAEQKVLSACDSMSDLLAGGYLAHNFNTGTVLISPYIQGQGIFISTKLDGQLEHCSVGAGAYQFYVFDSATTTAHIECSSTYVFKASK